jgi:hypothetical protein
MLRAANMVHMTRITNQMTVEGKKETVNVFLKVLVHGVWTHITFRMSSTSEIYESQIFLL